MEYRRLGRAGIKISELSFGAWLTFGDDHDESGVKAMMRQAFDAGVNFFDNAEAYGNGVAEQLMGAALKDYRREDIVVSTKIFWGGEGPNGTGLSWKRIMEGSDAALKRLGLDHVDLIFCHRPDPDTPIEETVRAMDLVVRSGRAFYWGTSEWPAEGIEEAQRLARELGCIPPAMEQPQYNMLHRGRIEEEYSPLFERYGMGTTIWSPLGGGLLSGKYSSGIPAGSRFEKHQWLRGNLNEANIETVRKLQAVADDLGATLPQLAIAWCLRDPARVSSVILGASHRDQLAENLKAIEFKDQLSEEVLARIEEILPG